GILRSIHVRHVAAADRFVTLGDRLFGAGDSLLLALGSLPFAPDSQNAEEDRDGRRDVERCQQRIAPAPAIPSFQLADRPGLDRLTLKETTQCVGQIPGPREPPSWPFGHRLQAERL